MSDLPRINVHLVRSVAKTALKIKGLPNDNLDDMVDFVRMVLVSERKYYQKNEARVEEVAPIDAASDSF